MGDKTFVMVNSPSLLGVNFRLMISRFRFLASNHTLSPLAKDLKHLQEQEDMTC